MTDINPFIRYIALIDNFSNKFFTKAYDCRFIYVVEGSCTLHTEQGDFELKQDSLAYYPCGVTYFPKKDLSLNGKFISVNFDFTLQYSHLKDCIMPVAKDKFDPEKVMSTYSDIKYKEFSNVFIVESVPYIKEDLMRLISLHKKDNELAQCTISSLMSTILYNILYSLQQKETSNDIVKNIKNYIKTNFFNEIDNKKIANELTYHAYYINSVFKKHTGKTIHKYLMEYRIKQSCTLLISTNMNISDIAFACGFSNQTHFSSYFKKTNHISPLNYRKKYNIV